MERLTKTQEGEKEFETFCSVTDCGLVCEKCFVEKIYNRLAELEDKIGSGQLVDTAPYIDEIKSDIPFKYKVIKPTMHRRNVEMCDSKESAEACLKRLEARYANKTRK